MTAQPPQIVDQINATIARRLAAARKQQGLTFDELAARSGVSKGMLVYIEQGRANPSIATLCKLASSLRLSVEGLVSAGEGDSDVVRVVAADNARELWRGAKGGAASLLVGSQGPDMLELWHWSMFPGERFEAQPHRTGTLELITVTRGTLALELEGMVHRVRVGSSAAARTDRSHAYACYGRGRTAFTMVVFEKSAQQ